VLSLRVLLLYRKIAACCTGRSLPVVQEVAAWIETQTRHFQACGTVRVFQAPLLTSPWPCMYHATLTALVWVVQDGAAVLDLVVHVVFLLQM
jgi:hypothetical protein